MSRRALTAALVAPLLAAAAIAACPASAAALAFAPCAASPGFDCAALAVPLDRGGRVGGAITLRLQRREAGQVPAASAVVALAGGPGQATLPLAEFITKTISPALGARDLILFDQRGTGSSDPLTCPAL